MGIRSPAAGPVAAERAVAAPELAASRHGAIFSPEAAASEVRLHHLPFPSHEGERGTGGEAGPGRPGRDQTHLTHTPAGLCELNRLAAG